MIEIGDQVKEVNGVKCKDCNDFFRALRFAAPCARIIVNRDDKKAEELEARVHIPADRAVQRREGYVYELATLVWVKTVQRSDWESSPSRLAAVSDSLNSWIIFQNRVLVSRVDPGTLAEKCLVLGDVLCDVDGVPVTDKDVAKDLLVKNLREKGTVTFVVERPDSYDAVQWARKGLATNVQGPPSVRMPDDVKIIAARYRQALPGLKDPSKSAMSTGRSARFD
ncbi:hypothetical protein B9Z55_019369 [Caenorhabditis nigoni]|nr:hypothetical protein B9Z55_019369 [Caenorhabditis nigoni]